MSPTDLKRFQLFADLVEEDLAMLAGLLETRGLLSGQQLFREGQEAEGLVLVTDGRLRLERPRAGVLGFLEQGDVVGGASLVVVGTREVTAVAEQPTEVHLLTREAFHRFVEDAPRAGARVLEALARELAGVLRNGLEYLS